MGPKFVIFFSFCHSQRSLSDADPSSVRPSTFFSNRFNRLPQFSSDLNDIWPECEQYCPKSYGSLISIFCFYFFQWIFGYKKYVEMGILEVFGHFLQNCFTWDQPWNLIYMHIGDPFRCVRKMAPVGQIFGLCLVPNRSKYRFSSIFLKSFYLIHTKLDL